jgi:hypothetical protein
VTGRRPIAVGALALLLAAAASGAACSPKSGSAEELCSVLGDGRSFTSLFEQGFDPTDPQRATTQLQAAKVDLEQLHDAAPSEVRDDLEAETRYLDAVLAVLQRSDPDDPAAIVAGINGLGDERHAAEVASLELRSYQSAHCGGGTSSTASTAAAG